MVKNEFNYSKEKGLFYRLKKYLLRKRFVNTLKNVFEKQVFFGNVALRSVVSEILQESISAVSREVPC